MPFGHGWGRISTQKNYGSLSMIICTKSMDLEISRILKTLTQISTFADADVNVDVRGSTVNHFIFICSLFRNFLIAD